MNLQEQIRRILKEENFIPLESLKIVIKDNEDGFDVFIMDEDKKIGGISFVKDDLPNAYTIVDATIDDEYKGNRIYPKTIINLFKERPNIIINSVFRSPEAEKSWRHLLSDLPSNIGKSVKHYKEENTTLYQLKLKNLQEQISRMQSMMGVINENVPTNVKRRLNRIKKLLDVTLYNSYPCDFDNENHFKEGILYDIDTFLIGFEVEGMSSGEIKDFINEYLSEEIRRYYINASEDC